MRKLDDYNADKSSSGHIEYIVGGHIHNNFISQTNWGIPIIVCDSDAYLFSTNRFVRKRGHLSEQSITAFVPNYRTCELNVVRFGYGNDIVIPLKSNFF